MSADNGIYILISPQQKELSKQEYRVAHCQAIENIDYFGIDTTQSKAMEVYLFGNSEIFLDKEKAIEQAIKLEEEIGYVEYGVVFLEKRRYPFSLMSLQEANEVLK